MNSIASQFTTGYVHYVGRVGGLAIALGVGAAIAALAPTASADATPSAEGPSAAKSHPRPSQATDSTPTRRVPTSRPTALTTSSATPQGLGDLPRLFGNGTPDHPDGGILLGNGYSWTAQTCTTGTACKGGNGGFLGNGGNGFNGGDGGAAGWFGHGGNGGGGINDGTGGHGGTGGLFYGDGGNGGEGAASTSDNGTGGGGGDGGNIGRWGSGKGGNGGDGGDGYLGGTGGKGGSGALLGGLREAQLKGTDGANGISSGAALVRLSGIHIGQGLVTGIALNAFDNTGYVVNRVNQYIGSLSVIDTQTNALVTDSVAMDGVATSVAVGYRMAPPFHVRAYTTTTNASTLSVIDPLTKTVTATIQSPYFNTPYSVAVTTHAHEAYFLAERTTLKFERHQLVAFVNTDTDALTSTIVLNDYASSLAVDPSGKFLYATHPETDTVSVIDIAKKSVIKTINIANRPIAVTFGPAHSAYVISASSQTVEVIDTTTHAQIRSLFLGATPSSLVVSPDGSTVYVKNEDSSLSLIDTADLTVINTPPLTWQPTGGIAISPDGTKLYLGETSVVSVYALKPGPASSPN